MLVATSERIAGFDVVETIGEIFGITVRSRGLAGNIGASLKSLVGGEITQYTKLLEEARNHAVERMIANAQARGADAIIMMRFDSSEIGQNMSEIVAYGTAVKLHPRGRTRRGEVQRSAWPAAATCAHAYAQPTPSV